MSYLTSQPISGNLLTIDGLVIPELVTYSVAERKMYKEQNRNMNGAIRNTLIGIFPELKLKFGYMNKGRLKDIAEKLNALSSGVTYFDPVTNGNKTLSFQASDFDMELEDKARGLFKPFDVTLTAMTRK